MKLLDTSYLIDYSKGREPAREFYYEHRNDRLTASTAALAELSYGVVADQSRDLAEVREVFSWVEWLDVSAEDAIEFARIKDELMSRGSISRATANNDLSVLTREEDRQSCWASYSSGV